MKRDVRKLTDGAMMCAIVGVFLLINRQLGGMFEDMFLFLFPLPMIFFAAKYGLKNSVVVLAAMVLMTIVIAAPQTIFYVASESLIGLVYGAGLYEKKDSRKLLIATLICSITVHFISMVVYASFFGYNLAAEMQEVKRMFTSMSVSSGLVLPSALNLDEFVKTSMMVSVLIIGVSQGFITHVFARIMLKRLKYEIPPEQSLAMYFPPKWAGYLGIAGLLAYFYATVNQFADQMVQNIMQGLGMIGVFYLVVFGMIALVVFAATHYPASRKWIVLPAVLAVFIFAVPMAFFGFLYITTDMHRRWIGGISNETKVK